MQYGKGDNLLNWANTTLDADRVGPWMRIDAMDVFAIFIKWTGTPAGNFNLQCAVDTSDTPSDPVVVSSTTVAAGGAAGSTVWNISGAGYNFVRVAYTSSSSTGTITASKFSTKGR